MNIKAESKQKRKFSQRNIVQNALTSALEKVYHNATLSYPRDFGQFAADFEQWLTGEIESFFYFLREQGAEETMSIIGLDEWARSVDRKTGKSECNVYTYGRGGRTVAPAKWIDQRGATANMMTGPALELSNARASDLLRIVDAFNAYIGTWCRNVPARWEAYTEERLNSGEDHTSAQA